MQLYSIGIVSVVPLTRLYSKVLVLHSFKHSKVNSLQTKSKLSVKVYTPTSWFNPEAKKQGLTAKPNFKIKVKLTLLHNNPMLENQF